MALKLTRRGFVAGLSCVALPATGWATAPTKSLRPIARGAEFTAQAQGGIESLVRRSGIQGHVVCAVADVKSGLHLEALNGKESLPPASVAKALTALYAMEVLGSNYRFETRVIATGPIKNGVLKGDLVLQGGGDPTLNTDHLAALAAAVKSKGIREVRGTFKIDDSALPMVASIDSEQPDHLGYSPAVSGIALNYNRVHFEWKRGSKGYSVAMDARTEKYRPEVHMAKMKVIKRQVPVYTYADRNGVDNWTVASGALGKGGSRWLPVRRPAAYAGDVFATMMRANGVVLKKGVVGRSTGGTVLAQRQSVPLSKILYGMLKYSNNLTAEMVGMTATAARGVRMRSLKDSGGAMSDWAAQRYGMTGTRMVDHSGLGDASRMTAVDLVGALVKVRKTGVLHPLLKPFPMRDAKGRINKTHPIKVNAKTGTLNFVSGLGGFMTAADGTELAFAIFVADVDRRARIKRADREVPAGARTWNRSAKKLQQKLIERWGALYGS
ncbi:D-alanyl-D-alanine carboxypeptidase/D-alanyl-D-alanine-endopeptidase [Rhodobacteraceae bacterium M382]|nr:D-alanyl-D-alanine carboxypeptidase/D-alanyl-D-alanine-endopeptidase [Rhodobacteraceae bacterium M382]